jgi:hypothetical protein
LVFLEFRQIRELCGKLLPACGRKKQDKVKVTLVLSLL